MVCPANSWKASRGEASQVYEHVLQHKLSYKDKRTLNKQKTSQITAKINKIQRLGDLVNTALTEDQCIKTQNVQGKK